MAQSNIMISEKSEQALMKINFKLLESVGKRYKNKADIVNASICIAAECMEFIDSETIEKIIK